MFEINARTLRNSLTLWLEEDVGSGDVTTLSTVPLDHESKGIIHVKDDGTIAGIPVAKEVFSLIDEKLRYVELVRDGERVKNGQVIAEVEGSTRSILLGERLALNLLQRLSGISTKTRQMVDALDRLPVKLTDTRKTTPGLRLLEKYAVRVGGGYNHRFGLFDAVLIKDNHIKGAGGVEAAITAARNQIPHTMKIEVEVESLSQLTEALQAGADIIMLDNMSLEAMKEAVQIVKNKSPHVIIEASGNVKLETVKAIAMTGVDVISTGSLTYSVPSLDISLDLIERKGKRA